MAAFGFLNLNKPLGATSHDMVARARVRLGVKKIGHAGTLDPMATGVLVLCLGSATRLSEYIMDSTKRYRAGIRLGVVTDTYDSEGQVISQQDASGITREDVERVLPQFVGEIAQVPPMYSAIKQKGRKLYELARAGQTVERAARQVTISRIDIVDWSPPIVTIDVECSAGTYIRSLAYDIGQSLGPGASLASLVRTASGAFIIEDAATPDELFNDPDWEQRLISPAVALAAYPSVTLTGSAVNDIYNGRPTAKPESVEDSTLTMAYDLGGHLLAVLRAEHGQWKPQKVFYP